MDLSLLNCPVCFEPATNPRETNCCNQVFCSACIQPLQSCPFCRASRLTHHENTVVTRILNTLPATCPFECQAAVTRGNLEAHTKICEQRLFDCPAPTCGTLAIKSRVQFLGHLVSHHADDVESAVRQFYETEQRSNNPMSEPPIPMLPIRRSPLFGVGWSPNVRPPMP
ncbi:hypothetical protein BC937DRAFT_94222 [Endogone sp. FLAS-F59071]|nr:hypothetical protein BC937DRAFT_94222 [Endogone sp. FLAS-F59071]|eukprot:RUS14183.1 hypothetical protein BC937DRAFT_94222 [Endogone sp. FLAS-F59071]